jgi:hypothetical protein
MSEYWNRASLKIVLSRDSAGVKQKLKELYDPAISKLLAEPSVKFDFESGLVKINTPIATEANLGPYSIRVDPVTPMHMTGILKSKTVSATVKADGLDYKYSASMDFKVDVDWHPRPRTAPETFAETVKDKASQTDIKDFYRPPTNQTKWEQTVNEKGVVVAIALVAITAAASVLYCIATRGRVGFKPAPNGSIMTPFTHTIYRHNLEA